MTRLIAGWFALLLLSGCASSYWSQPLPERLTENIYLTASNAGTGLISFLQRNDGRMVDVDTYLDASMSRAENQRVQAQCKVDIDALIGGKVNGLPLALPAYQTLSALDCEQYRLVLETGPETLYQYSSGGTGIVVIHLRGRFAVSSKERHGTTVYVLRAAD